MTRSWVSFGLLVLGVFLAVRISLNVIRLYRAGGRLQDAQKELAAATVDNQRLKQQLQEVQTPQYMEREARDKLGYGKPGEIVVVIPEDEISQVGLQQQQKQVKVPIWEQWRKLYWE